MEKIKVTNENILKFIEKNVDAMNFEGAEVTSADVVDFITRGLKSIESRREYAKAHPKQKQPQEDGLVDVILAALTDTLQTGEQIVAQIGRDDVTKSKVVTRITKLIDTGVVEKGQVKIDKRAVCGYKLASAKH